MEAQAVIQLVISLLVRALCQFGERVSCNFCCIRKLTRENGGGFSHTDSLANSGEMGRRGELLYSRDCFRISSRCEHIWPSGIMPLAPKGKNLA